MKSFFLPIGQSAGASLPTLLSAMSCGATVPVTGLDILHITDCEADPVLPPLVRDINQIHSLLLRPDNDTLFPSTFSFFSFRPRLPSLPNLSSDGASAALLSALRGKGIPLSYKTDREAVDWAVSVLLSDKDNEEFAPFHTWIRKIRECISSGEQFRIAVLCDLCDPFSAGTAFSILRFFHDEVRTDPSYLALFCLAVKDEAGSVSCMETLSGALHSLEYQNLTGRPDRPGSGCADSVWLLSLPSCLVQSAESFRILYAVLARILAGFFSPDKVPAPGLHITNLPGTLTFHELGGQAKSFASFIHASAWLLSDLIPALNDYTSHPAPLRSLAPNTRNGMFRRLFHGKAASPEQLETLRILKRAFSAVLSEILSLIRFLPDQGKNLG